MILLVRLPASGSVPEAKTALRALGGEMDLTVTVRSLSEQESRAAAEQGLAYIVRVYGADRPGIVHAVTDLLARAGFNITDLETRVIPGEGGPVYVMVLELDLPTEEQGERMRGELSALAAGMRIEISVERLDEEML